MRKCFHPHFWRMMLLSAALVMAWTSTPLTRAQTPVTPVAQPPGSIYHPALPPQSNLFPPPADFQQRPAGGEGQTLTFEMSGSAIFPGTTRTITVYIPAAYRADKPACVYIGLDALSFRAAMTLDSLISDHSMPVTIAIGVAPGVVASAKDPQDPRFDRSFEFDTLDDRLARFLLEEVLPEVQRRRTPGGQPILLSSRADDRAIGGASTGGVAALNVAWQHPEAFHRVFTAIGTFVGMRGAERLYVQVRKTEPKPIRIFMQDGVYDQWPGGQQMGDWWMSNQTMERAFSFAGYEVNHEWGSGTHNNSHAESIFPAAMRWLWHDWPAAIQPGTPANQRLREILDADEPWRLVAEPCAVASRPLGATREAHLAADQQGSIFTLLGSSKPILLAGQSASKVCVPVEQGQALAFDANRHLFRALPSGGIAVSQAPEGNGQPASQQRVVLRQLHVRDFLVRDNGDIYAVTDPSAKTKMSELWLSPHIGSPIKLDDTIDEAAGLTFLPDAQWLIVTQSRSHLALSYRVKSDGTTDAKEPYYDLESSPAEDYPGARSVATDAEGRAYIATRLGVQVMDRNGRVIVILPLPGGMPAESLCFGNAADGQNGFKMLYVMGNHRLFARKLKVEGRWPASPPRTQPVGSPG